MSKEISIKQQIRQALKLEPAGDFLREAYARIDSPTGKRAFRADLGELFSEHLQQPGRQHITVGSPAIALLHVIFDIRAFEQLPRVISAFNQAELEAEEVDEIFHALLSIWSDDVWKQQLLNAFQALKVDMNSSHVGHRAMPRRWRALTEHLAAHG